MRRLATLLLAAGAGSALAQTSLQEIGDLYGKRDFAAVVVQGRSLLDSLPDDAQLNHYVGRALVDSDRPAEALPYLSKAVALDTAHTWVWAWAQVYRGVANYKVGDRVTARAALIAARDANVTRNATRNATANLMGMGLDERFDLWQHRESAHVHYHFSETIHGVDLDAYVRAHEAAYDSIAGWFGGGPAAPIEFFVWKDDAEATAAGMPQLGFARPELNVVHCLLDQTVGHEMTHVISYYAVHPRNLTRLINEGISVCFDQTGRDQLARARQVVTGSYEEFAPHPQQLSIAAIWRDEGNAGAELLYPLGGALVHRLIAEGGREKFLTFCQDQSYAHAREVYGDSLDSWLADIERALTE